MHKYASSYINSAQLALQSYNPTIPFASFLKQFFSINKKFGGKDRKAITQACYAYFRLGKFAKNITTEDAIITGLFLSEDNLLHWQNIFPENWLDASLLSLDKRIEFLQKNNHLPDNFSPFSFTDKVSNSIQKTPFSLSHLQQPLSFIRIRPGFEDIIVSKLQALSINFKKTANTISFSDSINIESFATINKEVVVQDYSSQQIAQLLQLIPTHTHPLNLWDCCAASGGKSILAIDFLKNVKIHVSDVRESILINLKKRLAVARIPLQSVQIANLTLPIKQNINFDIIVADVPCTGSGTWGRTPEKLQYFKEEEVNTYQQLQQKIISNTIPHLKKGGYYLYITCSVFTAENEENIAFIEKTFLLQVVHQQYFIGHTQKADTLFATLFKK